MMEAVPTACLERLAAMLPDKQVGVKHGKKRWGDLLDVQEYSAKYGLKVSKVKRWNDASVYVLAECPFDPDHTETARIVQFDNGGLSFGCFHDSCSDKGWPQLQELLGLHSPGEAEPFSSLAADAESRVYVHLAQDRKKHELDTSALVDDLLTDYSFKTLSDSEEILIYKNGVYSHGGESFIREQCELRVGTGVPDIGEITTHQVNEVIGHVKRSTYIEREMLNQEIWKLNLNNGICDTTTGEIMSHTPDFLSSIRIPVDYDPQATCPRFKRFLQEVLNPEDIPVIEEFFGFCLVPKYWIQKALLCTGKGANGKSTLQEVLKSFLGLNNFCSVSLHALETQRFATSSLFGTLANVCADLSSKPLKQVDMFKRLTGGDTITAEKKFKDAFSFVNSAKLVFSANRLPKVEGEDTYAFWRRWIIIDFPNTFPEDTADKELLEKLTTPEELSGLLNLALQGLERLRRNGKFSYAKTTDEIAEKYLRWSDPVGVFLEERCEIDPEAWASKDDIYKVYVAFCHDYAVPAMTKEGFGKELKKRVNLKLIEARKMIKSVRTTGWCGIELKE